MTNVNGLLRDHVTLTVECMDRIYLNGYIPNLQIPGQPVNFLIKHRGHPIPSPALSGKIGEQFVQAIKRYAEENQIPVVHFERGQRKDDLAAEYRQQFDKRGRGLHRSGPGESTVFPGSEERAEGAREF